ncbi:MAG: GNAT family N-acetyltransferase [Sphingopyxis sp.]
MHIIPADFTHPAIVALLETHFATMHATGPEESCHVLPIGAMQRADLFLFAAWDADPHGAETLLGIGAFQRTSAQEGEVKSMHTAAAGRRMGVGQALLDHIITSAQGLGITRLNLETGAMDFFIPARALYAKNGFTTCAPFGDYRPDPNSIFMTRAI